MTKESAVGRDMKISIYAKINLLRVTADLMAEVTTFQTKL